MVLVLVIVIKVHNADGTGQGSCLDSFLNALEVSFLREHCNVREYGLVTGLVATTINFLCDIFRDNLWGGDRVINTFVFVNNAGLSFWSVTGVG